MIKYLIFMLMFLQVSISNVLAELPKCKENYHNCFGKVKFTGGSYEGDFQNGKANGWGIMETNDVLYDGQFKNNKFEGQGSAFWANNKKLLSYDGEWSNNAMHGLGTLEFTSGRSYYGEFVNGNMDGRGKLTDKNNKIIKEGIWQNNSFVKEQKITSFRTAQQIKDEKQKEEQRLAKLNKEKTKSLENYYAEIAAKAAKDQSEKEEKLAKEEAEKQRIEAEKQRIKEKKEKEIKLKVKSKKSNRSIYGFAFNDDKSDLIKKGCKEYHSNQVICRYKGETIHIYLKENFPHTIERELGDYSNSGVSKINTSLQKKYKLIASPDAEEIEKFVFQADDKSELNYYYENKKNKKKPQYIIFSGYIGKKAKCDLSYKNCYTSDSPKIKIRYFSKKYYENNILKKLNKSKNKYNDR